MYKLNKTDKSFFISLIILIVALVVPITLLITFVSLSFKFEIPIIPEILFVFSAINYIFIVPLLLITQIVIFIIKIFSKNKNIKDWVVILLSLIIPLFFGYTYLVAFLMVKDL